MHFPFLPVQRDLIHAAVEEMDHGALVIINVIPTPQSTRVAYAGRCKTDQHGNLQPSGSQCPPQQPEQPELPAWEQERLRRQL